MFVDNGGGQFLPKNTNFAKGVALMLLLVHHLFYADSYSFAAVFLGGKGIWVTFSTVAKVCVAMFLILSGFGLSKSWEWQKTGIMAFYKKHIGKLYYNYWLIWLLFVPLGVVFFNRTFNAVYGDNYLEGFVINFMGLQSFADFWGYNPTWWFMSLILMMYVLFPVLYWVTKKYGWAFVVFCLLLFFAGNNYFTLFKMWVFPFVLGILTAQKGYFEAFSQWRFDYKNVFLLLLIVLLAVARLSLVGEKEAGTETFVDGLLAWFIIQAGYELVDNDSLYGRFIVFVGQHSFNIFLFHTFIFGFYFTGFTYFLKYPPLVFVQFLLVCLGISLAIEKLKGFFKRGINLGWRKFNVKKIA